MSSTTSNAFGSDAVESKRARLDESPETCATEMTAIRTEIVSGAARSSAGATVGPRWERESMAEETAHGYGARVGAERLVKLLDHVFTRNLEQVQHGARGTPICIWGRHGVGKTEIVQQLAAAR